VNCLIEILPLCRVENVVLDIIFMVDALEIWVHNAHIIVEGLAGNIDGEVYGR
jgi:hypothetical protein